MNRSESKRDVIIILDLRIGTLRMTGVSPPVGDIGNAYFDTAHPGGQP